jgi:L-alanine-DL-glutamate epimerase-like enolase superfamily enzyme
MIPMAFSRRSFLYTAGALAGGAAGCGAPAARPGASQPVRNHPLDGFARPNMKITDIKVIPLSWVHPRKNTWRSAGYVVWKTDGAITQIFTDQGIVGIGEGTPYEGPEDIRKYTEEVIKPLVVGKHPFDVELLTNRGTESRHARAPWAGLDCALWDVIGKALNKPVRELLAVDNEAAKKIKIYASSGVEHEWYNNGEQFLIEQGVRHKEEGYDLFKFRTGTTWAHSGMTLARYIPIIRKLREAVGPDFKLAHESMGGTGVTKEQILKEFCPVLEELKFTWFEEAPGGTELKDIDFFLKLQEALPNVRVSGGERFSNRFEAQVWLDRGALDIIQCDSNVAGITENWHIARMAHLRGKTLIPHNWHGGGSTMANANLVAGIPNREYCELNQTENALKEGIFKEPLKVVKGEMTMPDKPGYGVELIDDLEKKFPYVPGSYQVKNPVLTKR